MMAAEKAPDSSATRATGRGCADLSFAAVGRPCHGQRKGQPEMGVKMHLVRRISSPPSPLREISMGAPAT